MGIKRRVDTEVIPAKWWKLPEPNHCQEGWETEFYKEELKNVYPKSSKNHLQDSSANMLL